QRAQVHREIRGGCFRPVAIPLSDDGGVEGLGGEGIVTARNGLRCFHGAAWGRERCRTGKRRNAAIHAGADGSGSPVKRWALAAAGAAASTRSAAARLSFRGQVWRGNTGGRVRVASHPSQTEDGKGQNGCASLGKDSGHDRLRWFPRTGVAQSPCLV